MESRLSALEWFLCAVIASAARASTKRFPYAIQRISIDLLEQRLLRGPIRLCVRCGDPFTGGPTARDHCGVDVEIRKSLAESQYVRSWIIGPLERLLKHAERR